MTTIAPHRMAKVDTAWLHMESPSNPMMVTSVLTFDEPLDVARVRRVIDTRLLAFERFRERVTTPLRSMREPRWEPDPHFDLDAHLHHVALPSPGGDAELQELVADLMSTPLDRSRPLWTLHVVDGYGEGSALISRVHHCIADGIALGRVLLSLTDAEPTPPGEEDGPGWQVPAHTEAGAGQHGVLAAMRHLAAIGISEAWSTLNDPGRGVRRFRTGLGGLAAVVRVTALPVEPASSLKGTLRARKWPAWSDPIPLPEIKAIGSSFGATVNDVLVTAATGALRRYMIEHGDAVDGHEIHATVPVNLRPLESEISLGNRFGLVYPALPIGIGDPLARLHAVKDRMDELKSTLEGPASILVLDLLGRAPRAVERAAIGLFTSKSSTMMTNVPGPREIHYFAGAPLRRVIVWAPVSGSLAMSLTILSYAGAVTVGVATDTAVIPHPEAIIAAFREELAALARPGDGRAPDRRSGRTAAAAGAPVSNGHRAGRSSKGGGSASPKETRVAGRPARR